MRECRIDDTADTVPAATDWVAWHRSYDDPDSVISRRLAVVRTMLAAALDAAPPGPISLLSVCAGDGRDVLGVLDGHPRAADVSALLVDLEPGLVATARRTAEALRLADVAAEVGDAGLGRWFERCRPVQVLMACGVFGNVSAEDVRRTVDTAGLVASEGGRVVWTRHRRPPDQTPAIRRWFAEAGFAELSYVEVPGSLSSVGCHLRTGAEVAGSVPDRIFTFVGDGSGAHT